MMDYVDIQACDPTGIWRTYSNTPAGNSQRIRQLMQELKGSKNWQVRAVDKKGNIVDFLC